MNAIEYMKAHQAGDGTAWKEQAAKDRSQWEWKRYAKGIALKARKKMSILGLTQKMLAETMGCSQQYVSLILKGETNLTLETMAKIEKVLNIDLLGNCTNFGDLSVTDGWDTGLRPNHFAYLSDTEPPQYGGEP